MITFEYKDYLPVEIEAIKDFDLANYEADYNIHVNYKKFFIVACNEEKHVVGILAGYTAYAEIYIDDIWVHSTFRKKGYGQKLLEELERNFEGKGFNNINLVTSEFQAPAFYEKCGFTLEFIRKNQYNPPFTKYFFVKYFKNREQSQGFLDTSK